MKIEQLLILQIIAHLLTDYTFQPDKLAKEKNRDGFKSKFLKWHILIAFLLSLILSFQFGFVPAAIAIALVHWALDGIKVYINKNNFLGRYSYFIDQAMHIVLIFTIVLIYDHFSDNEFLLNLNTKYIVISGGFLFCAKPSNIIIKEIFKLFNISIKKDVVIENDLPNAGKLIGIIERWLILVFILINQFEAVGFLIAAKSILRFKDNESYKTEYVLIGTMLSFGLAIITGMLFNII